MSAAEERKTDAAKLLEIMSFCDIETILRSPAALSISSEAYRLLTTAYVFHLNREALG